MRLLFFSVVLFSLAMSPQAGAQAPPPRVQFDDIKVGFSGSPEAGEPRDNRIGTSLLKAGFWAPVYVSITPGPDGIKTGSVIVEAADNDDVQNRYTLPFPRGGIPAQEPFTFLTYTQPSSLHGKVTVTVEADGKRFEKEQSFQSLSPGDALYLTLGSRLEGLRQALAAKNTDSAAQSQTRVAYVDGDLQVLPNRWFGYAAVDLAILTTGNRDFVSLLLNERGNRKEALAEWVRRGGRLVVSFGRNQDMVPELLRRMQIDLPVSFRGPMSVSGLPAVQAWVSTSVPALDNSGSRRSPGAAVPPIEVAKIERKPPGGLELIVPGREDDDSPLLITRAAYGLGQVILVAFDLDGPPFTTWKGQGDFWKELQKKTRTRPIEIANAASSYRPGTEQNDELAGSLERDLENFQDIPVISFGWVALFIFLYILVVGPLDYFFLKKIVKRLELTWITFPTIVLLVSAAAYFAAYALKGNDLRINKVDVVDIDLHSNRVFGNSWFTLFSPRIQLYTVGIEPGWLPDSVPASQGSGAVVSWMGRPDTSYSGYNRPRSQSLFRRTYDYAPDAAGLRGVPIQVWSTKSFSASWERQVNPSQPLLQTSLRQGPQSGIEGSITSRLPAPLEDAVLLYGEGRADAKVYSLGTIFPGTPKHLSAKAASTSLQQWVSQAYGTERATSAPGGATSALAGSLIKHVLFYGVPGQPGSHNTALQYLDQSWRRSHVYEAILVGRFAFAEGAAMALNEAPEAPSRLWLGELPESGGAWPALVGSMAQATYVRSFLPVGSASAGERNQLK